MASQAKKRKTTKAKNKTEVQNRMNKENKTSTRPTTNKENRATKNTTNRIETIRIANHNKKNDNNYDEYFNQTKIFFYILSQVFQLFLVPKWNMSVSCKSGMNSSCSIIFVY